MFRHANVQRTYYTKSTQIELNSSCIINCTDTHLFPLFSLFLWTSSGNLGTRGCPELDLLRTNTCSLLKRRKLTRQKGRIFDHRCLPKFLQIFPMCSAGGSFAVFSFLESLAYLQLFPLGFLRTCETQTCIFLNVRKIENILYTKLTVKCTNTNSCSLYDHRVEATSYHEKKGKSNNDVQNSKWDRPRISYKPLYL